MRCDSESDIVVIGKLAGVYGTRGWFRLVSFTQPREVIFTHQNWLIQQHGQWQKMLLSQGRVHGKGLIVAIECIVDRDQAMGFVGSEVAVRRGQLPATKQGEFYCCDLINMQIINRDNVLIGVVSDIMGGSANDVLVARSAERQYLIPYVPGLYIDDVDVEQGVIRVDWQVDYL